MSSLGPALFQFNLNKDTYNKDILKFLQDFGLLLSIRDAKNMTIEIKTSDNVYNICTSDQPILSQYNSITSGTFNVIFKAINHFQLIPISDSNVNIDERKKDRTNRRLLSLQLWKSLINQHVELRLVHDPQRVYNGILASIDGKQKHIVVKDLKTSIGTYQYALIEKSNIMTITLSSSSSSSSS